MRTASSRQVVRAAVFGLALITAACSDTTGPGDGKWPGRRLVSASQFVNWMWVPGKTDIVFSTPVGSPGSTSVGFDVVSVVTGARRTVAEAPTNGDLIEGIGFVVAGSHVYYRVVRPSVPNMLYRAALDGATSPEKLLDSVAYFFWVSPDERTVAWTDAEATGQGWSWSLVTVDMASGARRVYPLEQGGDRVTWSPSGRSVVIDPSSWRESDGAPLQWVDLATGAVRVWLEREPYIGGGWSREIGWEGETPTDYVVGADIARYPSTTGTRESLSKVTGTDAGWGPDFTTVVIQTPVRCTETKKYTYGDGSYCVRSVTTVERLAWKSGARTTILSYDGGATPQILARAAPDGSWLAYANGGDGLYAVPTP